MLIRLDRITEEPCQWQETLRLAASTLDRPELLDLGEIAWRGQVTRTAAGHLLQAELEYEQTLTCHRCLKPTASAVASAVELVIVSGGRQAAIGEVELEEKELSLILVDGEELDTQPLLLEQLQLNVPMRTLCRPECRGLCPACGADRNEEACDCELAGLDPRWSALADLGEKLKD